MNFRESIITSLISLVTFAPCKAQNHYCATIGVTKSVDNKISGFCGPEIQFITNKNFTDVFVGGMVSQDKTASFVLRSINNYSWTKNISTWVREALVISGKNANSTLEVAPIKVNTNIDKLNISLAPAYTLYYKFKGNLNYGINTLLQLIYPITKKDKVAIETKYVSTPTTDPLKPHFGNFTNNISGMIIYMRSL